VGHFRKVKYKLVELMLDAELSKWVGKIIVEVREWGVVSRE
jgi:hypothetical protein